VLFFRGRIYSCMRQDILYYTEQVVRATKCWLIHSSDFHELLLSRCLCLLPGVKLCYGWVYGVGRLHMYGWIYGVSRLHMYGWVYGVSRLHMYGWVYGVSRLHMYGWVYGVSRLHMYGWVYGVSRLRMYGWVYGVIDCICSRHLLNMF
jgi:hypothetical protein